LSYEHETYKNYFLKGLPREGEHLSTPEGKGVVISVNVFKRLVGVQLEDGGYIEVSYKEKDNAK
jgi:cell fate regulator YaaT (PSP1 superfamily)